jgi:hypothetical protein
LCCSAIMFLVLLARAPEAVIHFLLIPPPSFGYCQTRSPQATLTTKIRIWDIVGLWPSYYRHQCRWWADNTDWIAFVICSINFRSSLINMVQVLVISHVMSARSLISEKL